MKIPKSFVKSDRFEKSYVDWIGVTVNELTIKAFPGFIVRTDSSKSVAPAVLATCSCGKPVIAAFTRVKTGRTKSCGHINPYYKDGEHSACYDLMNRYRSSAKSRHLSFELSYDEFYTLIKRPCHYCQIPPQQVRKCLNCKAPCFYNGIDRINSTEGYTLENSVPCCKICNRAKSDMTYNDFISYLNRIKSLASP